jgi:hypothetical protein
MPRPVLDEVRIHPSIREKVANNRVAIVKEVQDAVAANDVVIVGMAINPAPKKARRLLDAAGIPYKYLEYGSYFRNGGAARPEDVDRLADLPDDLREGHVRRRRERPRDAASRSWRAEADAGQVIVADDPPTMTINGSALPPQGRITSVRPPGGAVARTR